jgi:DnaB-helicase binding domain of primase
VSALNEVIPFLTGLRNDAQRSLYSKRLSERLGIPEAVVLSELKKRIAYPDRRDTQDDVCEKLSHPKLRKMDNMELLNLMIHHPQTIGRLGGNDFRVLLSDPAIVEIFDCVVDSHRKKGEVNTSEVMEKLNGEPAKGLLREIILSRPICSVDLLEHVLQEYEKKINERKLRVSSGDARAKGDLEAAQNRILYLRKQEKESRIQRD